MFFRKNEISTARDKFRTQCDKVHLSINMQELSDITIMLSAISAKSQYKEGDKIHETDLNQISNDISRCLKNMTKSAIEKNNDPNIATNKKPVITKPVDYIMTGVDYFYLLTMETLGCPDMHVGFNDKLKKTITECAIKLHENNVKFDMSKEKSFTAQRKKDAKELRAGPITTNMQAIKSGKGSSKIAGELLAEYQALSERQRRHGFFWKAFHKQENIDRNQLLSEMYDTLQLRLQTQPDVPVDLESLDPAKVARMIANNNIQQNVTRAIFNRIDKAEEIYGAKPLFDNNSNQASINDNLDLFNAVNEISNEFSQPVNQPKNLQNENSVLQSNDKNAFSLFN